MNKQRKVIYGERLRVLRGEDLQDQIHHMITDVVTAYVQGATSGGYAEDWDLEKPWTALQTLYPVCISWQALIEQDDGRSGSTDRIDGGIIRLHESDFELHQPEKRVQHFRSRAVALHDRDAGCEERRAGAMLHRNPDRRDGRYRSSSSRSNRSLARTCSRERRRQAAVIAAIQPRVGSIRPIRIRNRCWRL